MTFMTAKLRKRSAFAVSRPGAATCILQALISTTGAATTIPDNAKIMTKILQRARTVLYCCTDVLISHCPAHANVHQRPPPEEWKDEIKHAAASPNNSKKLLHPYW